MQYTLTSSNTTTTTMPPEHLKFYIVKPQLESEGVDKIIYNSRKTIVIWKDGTKTVATASNGEAFDLEIGFAVCVMKKMFGKKVRGRKLYRKLILSAETQDELSATEQKLYEEYVKKQEGK